MEPFSITCSTCQSRIKVRNEKLIGQVVNCPKCDSLVMIAAPQQITVANSGAPVDSMAMTKEGIAPAGLEEPQGELPSAFADENFQLEALEEAPPASVESWQPEEPILPSDEWASESSTKTKQYLLVGFMGAGGIGLAVVAFLAFMNWYSNDTGTEIADNEGAQPNEQVVGPDKSDADVDPDAQTNSGGPNSVLPSYGDDNYGTPQDLDPSPAGNGTPPENQGDSVPDSSSNPGESTDPNAPGNDPNSGLLPETPATGGEAENFQVNDPFQTQADIDKEKDETERVKENLTNTTLEKFAQLLDYEFTPTIPPSGVQMGPPPVTAEDLGLRSSFGREPLPPVDWNERREIQIPGIAISGKQTLAGVINTWTHAVGMPTRVSLDSLAAANLDRNQTVELGRFKNTTAANLSEKLAGAVEAQWIARSDHLQLRGSDDKARQLLPEDFDLAELTESPDLLQGMLANLDKLFPGTAKGWSLDGTKLKYDATLIDSVTWFRAIRLLENLRVAAGKTPGLEGYSPASLTVAFVQQQQLDYLDRQLSIFTVQEGPVGQAISRVGRSVGVNIWFDWPSLAKVGIGPGTTGLITTYKRTPRQIFTNYIDEFKLVFAIVDEKTLLVTSQEGYRTQPQLFVLKANGRTAEQWAQQLEDEVPLNEQGTGALVVFQSFDGGHIITRCCWPRIGL
ncbi:MAG: hypothetical protein AAF483_21535 [Planctomycetota bacterium]